MNLKFPRFHPLALTIWMRNAMVWRRLMGSMVVLHFGEPIIYLVGLGLGLGMFIQQMGEIPYLTFLASGFIASSSMMSASMEGIYAVFTRMTTQRTYDGMMNTPIFLDDIIAGEALWIMTKGVMTTCAILIVATAFGAIPGWQALLAIPLGALVSFAFCGIAMSVSALSPGYDFFNYYFTLFVTPMFVLSGVFYPVSTLPEVMQGIVGLFPLYHAVELIRPLVAGVPLTDPLLHVGVLVAYGLAGHYLAVVLIRKRLIV